MAPVIRAATLDTAPRRLSHRLASAPTKAPVSTTVPAASHGSGAVADEEAQRSMRQRMQAELDEAKARVEKEGRTAGLAQGRQEALAQAKAQRDEASRVVAALAASVETQIAGVEELASAVAFEALVKLLGAHLATPEGVRAMVERVMARVRREQKAVVHLRPGDLKLLEASLIECPMPDRFSFVADESVTAGGCLVELAGGRLDARLDVQLAQLRDVLVDATSMAPAKAR